MSHTEQIARRLKSADEVVDDDGIDLGEAVQRLVGHHNGEACADHAGEPVVGAVHPDVDQTVDQAAGEAFAVIALPALVTPGRADKDGQPALGSLVDDEDGEDGEERVAQLGHDEADHVGAAGSEGTSAVVANVPEGIRRGADAALGVGGDAELATEVPGDGGCCYAGCCGDDADGSHLGWSPSLSKTWQSVIGDLRMNQKVVNQLSPKDRDIAMVFQTYALYPHMTVRENMAFPLKIAHMPQDEIDRHVTDAANLLELTEHLDRKPANLSAASGSGSPWAARSCATRRPSS